MNFYLILMISFLLFLIFFSLTLLILLTLKKEMITNNIYLIIPAICITIWFLYFLFFYFDCGEGDFWCFYYGGRQVYINPLRIYDAKGFVYLPNIAFLFAISISLLPYYFSFNIFLIFNYIIALLILVEYDKILISMELKQKIQRFMFLMIISNGVFVFRQFQWNQTKYILFFLLIFILRREIQFNKFEKEKDLKFYLINYGLLIIAIGLAPYFIFLLFIYVFEGISKKDILNKKNVQRYIIAVLMFCAQNFVFFLAPSQFFHYIENFNMPDVRGDIFDNLIYLKGLITVPSEIMPLMTFLFVFALSIVSLIIIFKKELIIYERFGFFFLAYIFLGIHSLQTYLYLLLYSFVLLLFVPFLKKNEKGFEWVKQNKFIIISLVSITLILNEFRFPWAIKYTVLILLSLMMVCLILLYNKKKIIWDIIENDSPITSP